MFHSSEEEKKTETITPEKNNTDPAVKKVAAEEVAAEDVVAEDVVEKADSSEEAKNQEVILTPEVLQQFLSNTEKIKELDAYNLRLQADFDNYRRRSQREREDLSQYASVKVVTALLPVLDDLERALAAPQPEGENCDSLKTGVQMIQRQLLDVLAKEGLQEIETLGQPFDPYIHEAVMQCEAAEGVEENTITMVLRKGYKMKEKVIRAAMVQVAHK